MMITEKELSRIEDIKIWLSVHMVLFAIALGLFTATAFSTMVEYSAANFVWTEMRTCAKLGMVVAFALLLSATGAFLKLRSLRKELHAIVATVRKRGV
jgi:hypothetical protein